MLYPCSRNAQRSAPLCVAAKPVDFVLLPAFAEVAPNRVRLPVSSLVRADIPYGISREPHAIGVRLPPDILAESATGYLPFLIQ